MIMLFLDNDTDVKLDFDPKEVALRVMNAVLRSEGCDLDTEVNLLLTDDETIHGINLDSRGIDRATDVLSFPGLEYNEPGDFDIDINEADCIDPETGLIILGDIVISLDHVISQAEEYGHTRLREYAFLIAHSMLHLCGYDHMTEEEAKVMESKQESVLRGLDITRDRHDTRSNK